MSNRFIAALMGLFGLIELVLLGLVLFSRDRIIIQQGVQAYRSIVFGAALVALNLVILLFFLVRNILEQKSQKRADEELTLEKRRDPLANEVDVVAEITKNMRDVDPPEFAKYGKQILSQISSARELSEDFDRAAGDSTQPIIKNIAKELRAIRVRVLEDAKSINRRLVLGRDAEGIEAKLEANKKLLADADNLVLEALNYLDVKTVTTDVELGNLTDALRDLIKMI